MGRDSTESGEDSDLIICTQPKDSDRSNAAVKIDENCESGKGDNTKRYTCLYANCNASFNQEQLTGKESVVVVTPEKKYKCNHPNCSASFVRPNKLRAHERMHTNERPYICSVEDCLKSYTNSSHLKRHVLSVHKPKPVSIIYKCPFKGCEGKYKTHQSLKKHYKRIHIGLDYKCTECNAVFKKHKQLTLHSFTHTGTPDYSCKQCDAKFETEHQLRSHEKRGHKIYTCSVDNCTEGPFLFWTLYRKHMALKHRPDFICDICQRSFPFMFRLRMHKESQHNPSVVNPWSCTHPDCTHTFKEKRYLSQHVRHVHEGVCFTCPQEGCGKTFHWKASLDHHVRLHTASRPRPRPRKKSNKRKDCGMPKKSIAAKLANINVPLEIEKQLLAKETIDSEDDILINKSTLEASSTSCDESTKKLQIWNSDLEVVNEDSDFQDITKERFSDEISSSSNCNDVKESEITDQ